MLTTLVLAWADLVGTLPIWAQVPSLFAPLWVPFVGLNLAVWRWERRQ